MSSVHNQWIIHESQTHGKSYRAILATFIPMCQLYSGYLFICYNDVILCGRNFPLVLQCVGVRAAPSCVHFVTVSLSLVWAGRPVSG